MEQTLETMYKKRFGGAEEGRDRVWRVLTQNFFQQWVNPTDVVVDVGAGYCEFINNIRAGTKFALDLNPATPLKASPGRARRNPRGSSFAFICCYLCSGPRWASSSW